MASEHPEHGFVLFSLDFKRSFDTIEWNNRLKHSFRNGSQGMSRADDGTRDRLLEAAGEVFAHKGFVGASVGEITDRAGANRAAVNYHYRTKEDLYVAAVRHGAQWCQERHPMPTWPDGIPA